MVSYYSFIAYSGTGKTTYIEKLIAELKRRGIKVAAIKHDAHEFEIDKKGKDSWRFAQAGASMVAVGSQTKCAVMYYYPLSLEEILNQVKGADVILVEGWHEEAPNKILVHRLSSNLEPKLAYSDCLAVVCDETPDTGAVPLFPLEDPSPMVDFLISRIGKGN